MMYSWRIKLAGENTYPPGEDHSNNLCNFWWLSMICDVFLQSSVEVKRFHVRIFLWIVSCLHSGKRLKIELWITYFDIFYKTSEYCTRCDLFVFQFPVQLRLWQTRPRQVPGAQVSHSWLWRVRTRHGQLLLPQVGPHHLTLRPPLLCLGPSPAAREPTNPSLVTKTEPSLNLWGEIVRWMLVMCLVWISGAPYRAVMGLVTPPASSCHTAGQN